MALSMYGHLIIQAATPGEDPVKVGTLWVDTSGTPSLKVCTSISPYTFATAGSNVGGSDTQVQFNDGGVLGGDAGLVYNKTTDVLDVLGRVDTPVVQINDLIRLKALTNLSGYKVLFQTNETDGSSNVVASWRGILLGGETNEVNRAVGDQLRAYSAGGTFYYQLTSNPFQLMASDMEIRWFNQIGLDSVGAYDAGLLRSAAGVVKSTDGGSGFGAFAASDIRLGSIPATAGGIRLSNAAWIASRNAANSADVNALRVNNSNRVELGAPLAGTVYKTADESVSSSTVLQDDDHLTLTLAASSTYWFKFFLFTNNAGALEGVKVAVSGTVGVTSLKAQVQIWDDTTNALAALARVSSLGSSVGAGLGAGDNFLEITGTIETSTSGTFLLQWAQNTSGANATTMQRNSSLIALQVN